MTVELGVKVFSLSDEISETLIFFFFFSCLNGIYGRMDGKGRERVEDLWVKVENHGFCGLSQGYPTNTQVMFPRVIYQSLMYHNKSPAKVQGDRDPLNFN